MLLLLVQYSHHALAPVNMFVILSCYVVKKYSLLCVCFVCYVNVFKHPYSFIHVVVYFKFVRVLKKKGRCSVMLAASSCPCSVGNVLCWQHWLSKLLKDLYTLVSSSLPPELFIKVDLDICYSPSGL